MSDTTLENDIEKYLKQINRTQCQSCDKPIAAIISGQSASFGMPSTWTVCEDHIPTAKYTKTCGYNDYEIVISRREKDGSWSPFKVLFKGRLSSPFLQLEKYRDRYGEDYHPLYINQSDRYR